MENIKMVTCTNATQETINRIISEHAQDGWEFTGMSQGFPKEEAWLHFKKNIPESQTSLEP